MTIFVTHQCMFIFQNFNATIFVSIIWKFLHAIFLHIDVLLQHSTSQKKTCKTTKKIWYQTGFIRVIWICWCQSYIVLECWHHLFIWRAPDYNKNHSVNSAWDLLRGPNGDDTVLESLTRKLIFSMHSPSYEWKQITENNWFAGFLFSKMNKYWDQIGPKTIKINKYIQKKNLPIF